MSRLLILLLWKGKKKKKKRIVSCSGSPSIASVQLMRKMRSRSKNERITTCSPRLEIYKRYLKKQRDFLFFLTPKPALPLKSAPEERSKLFTKLFFSLSPSEPCLCWLRRYLELLTLCVNIAYNVTLNMQISTAQHLISHLSVKVPSVGSPVGPGLMSRRAPDRNMREEGEAARAGGRERRGREVKTLTRVVFGNKEGAQLFKARLITDRQNVKVQPRAEFLGDKWVAW